jgi:phosphatidylserine/phosphatidylglycerophosphate/cardiolipin synthase-like enzyme
MSIDGCWAYLGTGNFDQLSLRHNRELGIAVSRGRLVSDLEAQLFEADFDPAWEVTEPLPLTCNDYLAEIAASLF